MRIDSSDARHLFENEEIVRLVLGRIVASDWARSRFAEYFADCFREALDDDAGLTPQLLSDLLDDPGFRGRLISGGIEPGELLPKAGLQERDAPLGAPLPQDLDTVQQAVIRATIRALADEVRNPLTVIQVIVHARRRRGRLSKGERAALEKIESQAWRIERALRRLSGAPEEILTHADEGDLPIDLGYRPR